VIVGIGLGAIPSSRRISAFTESQEAAMVINSVTSLTRNLMAYSKNDPIDTGHRQCSQMTRSIQVTDNAGFEHGFVGKLEEYTSSNDHRRGVLPIHESELANSRNFCIYCIASFPLPIHRILKNEAYSLFHEMSTEGQNYLRLRQKG
jgi:hypothetical protein